MSYQFESTQPIDAELRRIADERILHAVDQIDRAADDSHAAVHEVRKDCKKLRGLLRLIRPAAPRLYKRENAAFRDTAASLSGLRDAEAAIETFDALTAQFEANIDVASLASVRQRLEAHKAAVGYFAERDRSFRRS